MWLDVIGRWSEIAEGEIILLFVFFSRVYTSEWTYDEDVCCRY